MYVGVHRITTQPLMAVRHHWQCPDCCQGEMLYTGTELTIHPSQYEHKCNNVKCGAKWHTTKRFPSIEFVPVPVLPDSSNDGTFDQPPIGEMKV